MPAFMKDGQLYKHCNMKDKCLHPDGPTLPITEFNNRAASPDGHTYTCKICEKERAKLSYKTRKEQGKIVITEEERKMRKQFYRDYYKSNKERKRQYDQEYAKTDKGKQVMKEGQKRRKERLKNQAGAPYELWEVVERDSTDGILKCQMCGVVIERVRDVQIDHVIPIAAGGIDELDNVRCVCATCNMSRPKGGDDIE